MYLIWSAQLNKRRQDQKYYLHCAANCVIAFAPNQSSSLQLHMSAHVHGFSSLHCQLCNCSRSLGASFPPSFPYLLACNLAHLWPVLSPGFSPYQLLTTGDTLATSILTVQSSSGENVLQLATFHTCF